MTKNTTSHLLNCISANARNVRGACSKCFRQLQCRLAVSLCHSLIPVSIALADQAHLKLCSQQTNSTQLNSTEPSAPESCTLATRLPSHPNNKVGLHNWHVIQKQRSPTFTVNTFIGIHAFRTWVQLSWVELSSSAVNTALQFVDAMPTIYTTVPLHF